ncbi:MAG: PilZ domain-containing protein [Deltaproteobacteria bacterium]|nr:PilZ domain-containing protein [Candidatus Anaeroferrophillus wilburensis]MBN2887939.1 PilZ domain-containing protein [Deltaproteobacteria bacterium]
MNEKRYFKRVTFLTEVQVLCDDQTLPGELLDISLKGALLRITTPGPLAIGTLATVCIYLPPSDITIRAEAQVVHRRENDFGFTFTGIDAEAMGHLRRLMELNTGNSEEITSELPFLLKK